MTTVSFYGNESTGGVADRRIETARQETTGGVAKLGNQDSIFTVDNELKQDTVCFRGKSDGKKSPSAAAVVGGTLIGTALLVGGLGLLHKGRGKIETKWLKDAVDKCECITEPCFKACSWVKKNCYNKVVDFFHKKS